MVKLAIIADLHSAVSESCSDNSTFNNFGRVKRIFINHACLIYQNKLNKIKVESTGVVYEKFDSSNSTKQVIPCSTQGTGTYLISSKCRNFYSKLKHV